MLTRRTFLPFSGALLPCLVGCEQGSQAGAEEAKPGAQETRPGAEPAKSVAGFALVELFTSEGCSSCPPADANLARLARDAADKKLAVYTLSYHVDYWNYLGWKDPFSHAFATKRQRQYARQFKSQRVYTPQMIVNGATEFVGSDRRKADQAATRALNTLVQHEVRIRTSVTAGLVTVAWQTNVDKAGDVCLALVQNAAQRSVTAGENRGRELTHVNVVRDLSIQPEAAKQGRQSLKLPTGVIAKDCHVVAFLQGKDGRITGATASNLG